MRWVASRTTTLLMNIFLNKLYVFASWKRSAPLVKSLVHQQTNRNPYCIWRSRSHSQLLSRSWFSYFPRKSSLIYILTDAALLIILLILFALLMWELARTSRNVIKFGVPAFKAPVNYLSQRIYDSFGWRTSWGWNRIHSLHFKDVFPAFQFSVNPLDVK